MLQYSAGIHPFIRTYSPLYDIHPSTILTPGCQDDGCVLMSFSDVKDNNKIQKQKYRLCPHQRECSEIEIVNQYAYDRTKYLKNKENKKFITKETEVLKFQKDLLCPSWYEKSGRNSNMLLVF